MRNNKSRILLASSFILVFGLLAACGSSNSSSNGQAGSDKVTLRMIESMPSPARTEVIKGMLAKFEAENPNIKVELISPPLESADNKIAQMLSTGETIDVLEVRDFTVQQHTTNEWIADLTPYTEAWEGYKTLTPDAIEAATYINNTPYYIPYGIYQKVMFYRPDWFESAGLSVPKTWEEVIAAGKQLTDPDKNRFGYAFRGGAGADSWIVDTIRDYNGANVNPEDPMFLNSGDTIFSSEEAKQGLNAYIQLYNEASPKDSLNWGFNEMVESFVSGVTGMLIQDPDTIDSVRSKMGEGEWATAPLPTGPQGVAHYKIGSAGWGIAQNSKHKDEAWKLIEFLSGVDQNTEFTKTAGVIPIHKAAAEDEFYKTGAYKAYMDMAAEPERYVGVRSETDYRGFGEWRTLVQEDVQSLILGNETVDGLLKKWDAYWINEKNEQAK